MTVKVIILRVDLTPGEAAGLKRLADKTGWSEAMAVLYPHIDREVRGDQARERFWVHWQKFMKHWRT
jgi:hypothetical protein